MAKEIKTRQVHKDIKALDKTVAATKRVKRIYVRTKEGEGQTQAQENKHVTPVEYVENKIGNAANAATRETVYQVRKQVDILAHAIKEKNSVSRENKQIKQQVRKELHDASGEAPVPFLADRKSPSYQRKEYMKKRAEAQQRIAQEKKFSKQTIKSVKHGEKTIKNAQKMGKTIKATGKGTVKTAGKAVKTAECSAKTAIKTTEQTSKVAHAAAKASVKTAKKTAQTVHAASRATAAFLKNAAKATITSIRAIIAGAKSLIYSVVAGGVVTIVIILLICMIGLLLSSVFGIFFSSESTESSQPTMQTVVEEINTEYQEKVEEIKSSTSYDVLEMSGVGAVWKEVLAVYAVKTNTDPENPQEVATIDDNKKQLLRDIFWEMNTISSSTDSVTETVTEESGDGHGNIVTTERTVTKTYLYIKVSSKTADEMAEQYGFNEEQKSQLGELLSEEYADVWNIVFNNT